VATADSLFNLAFFLADVLIIAALFGWGLQLVWNKFVPKAWAAAPTVTWIEGFALYLILALLSGGSKFFGS
jgi:drug/metabolite transporter (DMT)-like permease